MASIHCSFVQSSRLKPCRRRQSHRTPTHTAGEPGHLGMMIMPSSTHERAFIPLKVRGNFASSAAILTLLFSCDPPTDLSVLTTPLRNGSSRWSPLIILRGTWIPLRLLSSLPLNSLPKNASSVCRLSRVPSCAFLLQWSH